MSIEFKVIVALTLLNTAGIVYNFMCLRKGLAGALHLLIRIGAEQKEGFDKLLLKRK